MLEGSSVTIQKLLKRKGILNVSRRPSVHINLELCNEGFRAISATTAADVVGQVAST